jgi:SPP1 gp7 family putative phage head morphogenesis protein
VNQGQLQQVNQQYIDAIHAHDAAICAELLQEWIVSWERISHKLELFNRRVQRAKERGQFSPSWGFQEERYADLLNQVSAEITGLAQHVEGVIPPSQQYAISQAQAMVEHSISSQGAAATGAVRAKVNVSFSRLNSSAVENLVANLSAGSPLKTLIDGLPDVTVSKVREALKDGLIHGINPNVTARIIKRASTVPLIRAQRIARTETMRAYNNAAIESMRHNSVVIAWMWAASLSQRTCPVCLAMNGTIHPLDEPFASHVSCRCVPLPWTKSSDELFGRPSGAPGGLPGIDPNRGWQWFQAQPEPIQRLMVGPGKLRMLGEMAERGIANPLHSLVGYRVDPTWGAERFERTLRDIRENPHYNPMPAIHPIPFPDNPRDPLANREKFHMATVAGTPGEILKEKAGVNIVNVTSGTQSHWRDKHEGQFDMSLAEKVMPSVIANPWRIYHDRGDLVFVGKIGENKLVVVPVKPILSKKEAWVKSLRIQNRGEIDTKQWTKRDLLYEREE